jgi:hypothetical protein
LGLGAIQAQLDAAGGGVGEHVGQGVQAQAGLAGDREATGGKQRPDLVDGTGDGGAVHPVQHRQGLVGELQAQVHQGDQDPVAKDQPVARSGPLGALPPVPAALLQRVLVDGGPGIGQLGGQLTKVLPGDPGEARMGEGRTSPCWRRHPCMIVRPHSCPHDSLN